MNSKSLSIFLFVLGLFTFLGVDKYQDFYYDLKARYSGKQIDYSMLTDFCGYTGGPFPWESDFQYGLRAFWNMLTAMFAMAAVITIAFGGLIGLVVLIFHLTGQL